VEVEQIEWLPRAGYTQMGLWRVAYRNEVGIRTYRHYAHWKGKDELDILVRFMKDPPYPSKQNQGANQ
jgi:hypothetical protein